MNITIQPVLILIFGFILVSHTSQDAASFESTTGKIIGGEEVDIKDFPYQVALIYKGKYNCGGSIINQNFILTASHCLDGYNVKKIQIRAGSSYYDKGGFVHEVSSGQMHPEYDPNTFTNDVAILALKWPLAYSNSIQPVALPNKSSTLPVPGDIATVSGWGKLSFHKKAMSPHLMAVDVPIIPLHQCSEEYDEYEVNDKMMCAGYAIGGRDACAGDSGGPLVFQGVQIGIVSWGVGCANARMPGVYASVEAALDFIEEMTGRSF